jgi:spore coat polysaccharide biosynthesis protein SpsF
LQRHIQLNIMNNHQNIGIIVAARMNSSRLPEKVLKPLKGIPMLSFLIRRLKKSTLVDKIILATSDNNEDDLLAELAEKEGVGIYRGSLNNVTDRYIKAAKAHNIDLVVRITGDCPFVDGTLVDHCIEQSKQFDQFDLCSTKGNFPVGLDVEIYHNNKISEIYKKYLFTEEEREHLTLFYYKNKGKYNISMLYPPKNWQGKGECYTVDDVDDYNKIRTLADTFENEFFSIENLILKENNSTYTEN